MKSLSPILALPCLLWGLWTCVIFGAPEEGSALALWMKSEQTRLNRSVDPSKIVAPDIKGQAQEYRPDNQKWFDLPSVWIPEEELRIASLESLIPKEVHGDLIRAQDGIKSYRFFIHPESRAFFKKWTDKYPEVVEHRATATSSSRTVLVEPIKNPEQRYFAKLSLDVILGGVTRTIPAGEAARSVGATQYFLSHEKAVESNFQIIPEVLGIIPKDSERGAQLIRLIPDQVTKQNRELVPLFSLYSVDSQGRSLLQDFADRSKMSAKQFAEDKILKPFSQAWVDWAVRGGLVAEVHAQNVLMEFSREGIPTGSFYLRDGGGIYIRPNVAIVEKGELAKLPVFQSYLWDYQKFAQDAESNSLSTYFLGGFLYNLDKELLRVDPKYKRGSINSNLWKEISDGFSKASGVSKRKLTYSRMESDMESVLKEVREKASGIAYRPLEHGLGRPLRIGVYSGTFDPPHSGHSEAVEAARNELGLDIVYVVPNYKTPHKPNATPFKVRKKMAQLHLSREGVYVVEEDFETAARFRGADSLLELLIEKFDVGTQFFRVIGDDSLEFYKLAGIKETDPRITFAVIPRNGLDPSKIPTEVGASKVRVLEAKDQGYSSTELRRQIAQGIQPKEISDSVWKLILENQLYGADSKEAVCVRALRASAK